jgi:hypothetical protein
VVEFILVAIDDVLLNVATFTYFMGAMPDDELESIPDDVLGGFYIQVIKIGVAFIIPLVIYIYYFKRAVKEYFNLTEVSNISVIFKHIVISFILAVIYSGLTR